MPKEKQSLQASAIIVAAGQGTRFGGELPKQFLMLCQRPILAHTLQRFEQAEAITEVVLVASQAWVSYIEREIIARFQIKKCRKIVMGGEHRQDSVWAGFQALQPASSSIVVVHDAVRPLFTHALLERVIAACETADGCIPGLPLRDTVTRNTTSKRPWIAHACAWRKRRRPFAPKRSNAPSSARKTRNSMPRTKRRSSSVSAARWCGWRGKRRI
ncbi:hypothetical protein DCC62_18995 [candidate division KSB1 bacterium]|nr:MAG: hypothetical protein DCC62_18995 [candidate division KSB1 bacterium]